MVCDFDGTVTTEDIGDQLSIQFAGRELWQAAEDRHAAGEITFSELITAIFAPVKADRTQIAAWARDQAVLRPGLERFIARCRERRIPFLVVSAGLNVYVEPILDELAPELRSYIELRCNRASCSSSGLTVTFQTTAREGCGKCGFCKGVIVDELHAAGFQVAVLGDGGADRCAAKKADLIFARRRLPHYCEELGLPYLPFETFDDVAARFPGFCL